MSGYDKLFLEVMPVARSMIAKKLTTTYGFSQKNTAEKLGITQPAVSQYKRDLRGGEHQLFTENTELTEKINEIAKSIASGEITMADVVAEIFEICRSASEKEKAQL